MTAKEKGIVLFSNLKTHKNVSIEEGKSLISNKLLGSDVSPLNEICINRNGLLNDLKEG